MDERYATSFRFQLNDFVKTVDVANGEWENGANIGGVLLVVWDLKCIFAPLRFFM